MERLFTVHPGHGHVKQDSDNAVLVVLEGVEARLAVLGLQGFEAERLEGADGDGPDGWLVIDDEHDTGALPWRIRIPGRHWRNLRGCGRQEKAEGGAFSGRTVHLNRSMVTSHDAEDGGQAEAATGEFRREERVEDAGKRGRVHACAGVCNLDEDVLAGSEVGLEVFGAQQFARRADRAGPDGDDALAAGDSVRGVDDEVHDDLAELCGVRFDEGQAVREVKPEAYAFAD